MPSAASDRRATLERRKASLQAYLEAQITAGEDYHAIQDAASDIREIDARLDELTRAEGRQSPKAQYDIQTDDVVTRCGAALPGGNCALAANHAGPHRNADGWELPPDRHAARAGATG